MTDEFNDEYKFPDDEQDEAQKKGSEDAEASDELEIEIEDDTPPEDRNRKPASEPPKDPTDEELSSYDEKVQARIKKFTKGYHDERRAKEQAVREREAAESYARQIIEENKRLQQHVALGSKAYIEQTQNAANMEFEAAKKRYKEAYEAGDPDALTDAQAEMARATLAVDKAKSLRPLQVEEKPVKVAQQSNTSRVTDRDQKWLSKNTWFGPDPEMTASALGLHQRLAQEKGEGFIGSDEYYRVVDSTMRRRFPEYFGSTQDTDDTPAKTSGPANEEEPSRRATKPATVVAPATRSSPPNRIRLKASEASIARRLGVPLEQYAKQVALLKKGV